jgi:tetratricopeptide (TPR) repeat protein
MKRNAIVLVVGLALVALSVWLYRGNDDPAATAYAAYQSGDYATAVREYQRAAPECPDLGAIAVNQAAALYHLDHYSEADGRYQFAESSGDEARAAQAAYDRGNCALRQALQGEGPPDTKLLEQAAEQFRACLSQESIAPNAGTVFADARYNLELTKLLQAPPPSANQAKENDPDKNDPEHVASNDKDATDATKDESSSDSSDSASGTPNPENSRPTLASLISQHDKEDLCPT